MSKIKAVVELTNINVNNAVRRIILRPYATINTGGGGGGISDGDKGDITVSGSGATWTLDAGVVSLAKMADLATGTILGRTTAGTGAPEALTAAQVRGILNVANGATANAADSVLLARANHTGTQAAATITGLAAVATSGSASDLGSGILPAVCFDDTAHGSRAGGALHAAATGSVAGFLSAADKTKLDAITGTNTGDQTIALTGDVTGSGAGSFAATIAGNAVSNAKLADVASGTIKGRGTAGTGDPEDLTGAQATALLDVFGSAAKGLAPASGGGTTNFLRADGSWAAPGGGGGGGGVSDGDKGDVTVSGSGANWTIDAGAVSLSKMADLATSTILGRVTAGTGLPEALTAAQVRSILNVADGATANAADAFLLDRTNHTGTQAAATITGLAAVATSGSASDLGTGTLPISRIADGAVTLAKLASIASASILGNNTGGAAAPIALTAAQVKTLLAIAAGDVSGLAAVATSGSASDLGTGTLPIARIADGAVTLAKQADMATASVVYRKTAGTGVPEVQTLATLKTDLGLSGTNTGDQTITLTGEVTGSGSGSFAATIAADAVTNAKLANVATATIKGRATAGTGDPEDLTGTQATALLDTFTSGAKGLVPASGGGTTNFLRADGTWAAATHTHTASQVTDFSEAVDDRVSALLVAGTDISLSYNDASNTLTITSTAPGAPGGAIEGNYMAFYPHHISNYDTYTLIGVGSLTMSGSRYTPEASVGTPLGRAQRVQVRFTGSSTTNCASVRSQYTELFTVNGPGAGIGGFKAHMLGAPSVGCTNSSHRFFMGMIEQKASLPDQNPSGMTNFVGIGYDSADSQLHIMHNDGSGSATKVALGASFPKPTSDNSVWYRLRLTAPAGTTRTIDWEVTELQTGAVASGTITTDLPATDKFVSPAAFNGVGGVSAPISLVLGNYVVYS